MPNIKDVSIDLLLHDDKYAYVQEGHGGNPVSEWPIYHFFKLYYEGNKDEACLQFQNWYLEQYQKYSSVEGERGGMKNGSLDRLYRKLSATQKEKVLLNKAIEKRVQQRFNLMDNILENGYNPNDNDPVKTYMREGGHYLFGGHHRVACLAVLGYKKVPRVYIFKSNLSLRLYKFIKRLKC